MRRSQVAVGILALALAAPALGAPAAKPPRPDLADAAQGVYHGDVVSDSRGSSRSDVTVTVTKTGPNTVQVTSDYPRLPTFTTKLSRYPNSIQNVGPGVDGFLLDLSKSPKSLDVTNDGARWTGAPDGAG